MKNYRKLYFNKTSLRKTFSLLCLFILLGCGHHGIDGKNLNADQIKYIQSLGILAEGEKIIDFDSQSSFKQSGSFYTDQGIGEYWIDNDNEDKTIIRSALYKDIDNIESTNLSSSFSYSSYLEISKKDGETLKLHVDRDSLATEEFFKAVNEKWKSNSFELDSKLMEQTALEDGMYLILRTSSNKDELETLENEVIVPFNQEFLDKTDQTELYLVINRNEFVPLYLKSKPEAENQEDNRKRLLLTLTDEAKADLTEFTTKHLNKMTGIVVNGEALTKHMIRTVIDGGKLQISRCTDNACEMLDLELQDNVVD